MSFSPINLTASYEFCIIIPIYNEEENLLRVENELETYIKRATITTCVLLVNDGSSDNSLSLMQEICSRNKDFFYISFTENAGLSAAIKAGIDLSQSKFIGYIDADLQTSPSDFDLLLEHRDEYALVTGIRTGRKDSLGKRVSSKIANSFRRFMTKDDAIDTGCPLKVIQSDFAKRIPFFKGMHRFIPALIQLQNGKVKQIPIQHFERIAGKSKFNMWNRLTGPLTDCFAFRWMKKRYINYDINTENIRLNG